MAYPVYQGTGGIAVVTSGTTVAVTLPSGIVAGDILIANLMITEAHTFVAPSGWTLIQVQAGTATHYSYASMWRRATGAESGTVTFTGTTFTGAFSGIIYRFNNCRKAGIPYESLWTVNTVPTTGFTKNTGVFETPSGTERLGVCLGITEDDTAQSISGTGWTQSSLLTSALGTDCSFALGTKEVVSNLDGCTLTMSSSLDYASVVSFMLLPEPVYPYFSGQGSLAESVSSNIAVSYPTDVLAGDILFIMVFYDFNLPLTTPSGWTELTRKALTVGEDFYVFWKRAAGGETGTVTVTNAHGSALKGVMSKFTNCVKVGTPYENYDAGNSATYGITISYSLGNSNGDKRTALIIVSSNDDQLLSANTSTGYTKKIDIKSAGTFDLGLMVFIQEIATSATNDGTVSISFTTAQYNNYIGLFLIPTTNALVGSSNGAVTTSSIIVAKVSISSNINAFATTTSLITGKSSLISASNVSTTTAGILNGFGRITATVNNNATTVSLLINGVTIVPISGIINGIATKAAILTAKGIVQAVKNIAITISGVLLARGFLVGNKTVSATTVGIMNAKGIILANINNNATTAGILTSKRFALVTVNASASLVGVLIGKIQATTTNNSVATTSGTLLAKGYISDSETSSATTSGLLNAIGRMLAVNNNTATTQGNLTSDSFIYAESFGVATLSGVLSAKGTMAQNIYGSATTTGVLTSKGLLLGEALPTATTTGILSAMGSLSVTVNASANIQGLLSSDAMAVTVEGSATTQGVLKGIGLMESVANAFAYVEGFMGSEINISGTSSGQTTTSSLLKAKGLLLGESNGVTTVSASLFSKGTLTGNALSQSSLLGSLIANGSLSGNSQGTVILSGTLTSDEMNAVSNGSSITQGILTSTGSLSGQANGLSALTIYDAVPDLIIGGSISLNETSGKITATGNLNGLSQGSSTVIGKLISNYIIDKKCLVDVKFIDKKYEVVYLDSINQVNYVDRIFYINYANTEYIVKYTDKNYYVNYHCKKQAS